MVSIANLQRRNAATAAASVRLDDNSEADESGIHCLSRAFPDIQPGMEVIVQDDAGRVLGAGETVGGEVGIGRYDEQRQACVWTFKIDDVGDADIYRIEVGERRSPAYSRADLEAMGWDVTIEVEG